MITFPPIALALFGLALWMMFSAQRQLKPLIHSKYEAEKMFRQRVIKNSQEVAQDLKTYFKDSLKRLKIAGFYYFLAYVLVVCFCLIIKNGGHPSPVWVIMLFVLALFIIPMASFVVITLDLLRLRSELFSQLED